MMIRRSHRGEVRGGFTLMEILVVVAIIVLLAAAAAPIVIGRLHDAQNSRALLDCKAWTTAADSFNVKYGNYPASLEALCQPGADGSLPFMETKNLVDPWGRPYQYQYPGQHNALTGRPDIWSLGKTGSQQIGNWMDRL
jgi:general secretion pathway protein G